LKHKQRIIKLVIFGSHGIEDMGVVKNVMKACGMEWGKQRRSPYDQTDGGLCLCLENMIS
jgi:hypothetical protein